MVENAPQLLPSLVALFAGAAALWLLRRLPLSSIAADLELVPALVAVIVGALTFGLLRRKRPAETATAARRGPPAEEPPPTPPARPPLPEPTADLERIAECVVCLEQIERSALGSCPHHFCVACLLECCRLTPRCPKCSTKIEAVWLDTDFDVLLRHARASEPPADALARREACEAALRPYVVHLRLPKGACAGVTLRGCPGRPGVAVALALERDMAYRCGLRVGDLLVSMNGAPRHTHAGTHGPPRHAHTKMSDPLPQASRAAPTSNASRRSTG